MPKLNDYLIKLPSGLTIEANSDTDHARAMEAIEKIGSLADLTGVVASPPPAPTVPIISPYEARKKFISSLSDNSHDTRTKKASTSEEFIKYYKKDGVNPLGISGVKRSHISEYFTYLANNGNATNTRKFKESNLIAFFDYLINAGFYSGENPARGQVKFGAHEKRIRIKEGFVPFSDAQINEIFKPDNFTLLPPEARLGVLLGLYTGARVGEIAQLFISDIDIEARTLKISDENIGQSVKNYNSIRVLPIHPVFEELGFFERVKAQMETGDKMLFPNTVLTTKKNRGNWLSNSFSRYLDDISVSVERGKIGFHSFRSNAIGVMKKAGINLEHASITIKCKRMKNYELV